MSSFGTIIICIALFSIVLPARSTGVQSREYSIRSERQTTKQDSESPYVKQQFTDNSYQYRPFSSAPDHIKQLIYQTYAPHGPYVNPHSFFYNINSPTPYHDVPSSQFAVSRHSAVDPNPSQAQVARQPAYKKPSPAQTVATISKMPKTSGMKYKNDFPQQEHSKRSPEVISTAQKFGLVEKRRQSTGHHMPEAIEQLLQYQARIPYNVLANYILFKSEKPFVPKPLPENVIKRSGTYPNQVYYLKTDGEIYTDNTEFLR